MPKYFARFANDYASAAAELEAPSIESAYASALELSVHQTGLHFETVYRLHPVDEIAVIDPGIEERIWESDTARVRRLAPELRDAADELLDALHKEHLSKLLFSRRTYALIIALAHLVDLAEGRQS
ncbi:hypothetical protein [Bradyrhizobium sp. CCGUVB14]|uniref:hypothetical protein n=1 Tax=Bradyrhizobium sp. CCGUVB14 TaxID=2949628 RepID=UPI0020B3E807|nr:hypothetical protein [Bradyrhizobium sp. CCGUVB14]MCP3447354.1 hypothetical protein [Bradyrhizobium sp. CCGUVB14]